MSIGWCWSVLLMHGNRLPLTHKNKLKIFWFSLNIWDNTPKLQIVSFVSDKYGQKMKKIMSEFPLKIDKILFCFLRIYLMQLSLKCSQFSSHLQLLNLDWHNLKSLTLVIWNKIMQKFPFNTQSTSVNVLNYYLYWIIQFIY